MAPVRIFISYSHEDGIWLSELIRHLGGLRNTGVIEAFHDKQIKAGDVWEAEIESAIKASEILLLIVTKNFLNSEYCSSVELNAFLEERKRRNARVISIIAAPCDWESLPITELEARPIDHNKRVKPISQWYRKRDEAFTEIAKEIRSIVQRDFAGRESESKSKVVDAKHEVSDVSIRIQRLEREKADLCKFRPVWPTLYIGVAPGAYWHKAVPHVTGFWANSPGGEISKQKIIQHVLFGRTGSTFISMVRSYDVAYDYATFARTPPSKENPGYVYEIEIPSAASDVSIIDPLIILSNSLSASSDYNGVYHNGGVDLLRYVVDPVRYSRLPNSRKASGSGGSEVPTISLDLQCLVSVLRDTEVLAVDAIPAKYILRRNEVW